MPQSRVLHAMLIVFVFRWFAWSEYKVGHGTGEEWCCQNGETLHVHYGQYIRCIMYIKHNLLSSVFVWRIRTKCIGRPTELCLRSEEGHSQVLLFYVLESYQMCVEQYNRSIFHMNGETRACSLQALTTTTQLRPLLRDSGLSRGSQSTEVVTRSQLLDPFR